MSHFQALETKISMAFNEDLANNINLPWFSFFFFSLITDFYFEQYQREYQTMKQKEKLKDIQYLQKLKK